MCQAYKVQAGGGSVHVQGTFHSGAKSTLVLPDKYPNQLPGSISGITTITKIIALHLNVFG